jgi:diguanylate cyclase (GGDEF)-like protein
MKESKTTLMQLQCSLPKKIIITAGIMFALILLVYYCNIPNPNMILIAGLVLCSALFGFGGGIVAALIMLGYTLFFFSTDYSFTQFTPENMQKVIVSLIGIVVDMVLVCALKQTEIKEFNKIESLTKELHRENEALQYMSMTDALTGIRNRMALRRNYDSYQGHEVTVMMLDINDFKMKNDTYGHEEGDRVLKETGKLLSDTFGENHCYRYGGDEFLVIVPDLTEAEFKDRLESMRQKKSVLMGDSEVSFSAGYVHELLEEPDMLRALISRADEMMYEEKRRRK